MRMVTFIAPYGPERWRSPSSERVYAPQCDKRVIHRDNRENMLREIRGSLELLKALGVPINLESRLA